MNSEKAYIKRLEIHKKIIEDKLNYVLDNYMSINYKYRDLEKRIQKAIEYIENNSLYKEEVDYDYEENPIYIGCNDIKAKEELLNILKGEE